MHRLPIVNVRNAKYRPMGIAFSDDGSMYIADSRKGKIWRIQFKGKEKILGKTIKKDGGKEIT